MSGKKPAKPPVRRRPTPTVPAQSAFIPALPTPLPPSMHWAAYPGDAAIHRHDPKRCPCTWCIEARYIATLSPLERAANHAQLKASGTPYYWANNPLMAAGYGSGAYYQQMNAIPPHEYSHPTPCGAPGCARCAIFRG